MAKAAASRTVSGSNPAWRASLYAIAIRRESLVALACGAALAVPWIWPSLWPLEWLAMIPAVWLVLEAKGVREAALQSFIVGFAGVAVAFWWLIPTIHRFGEYSIAITLLLFTLLSIYMGGQWALFGALARRIGIGRTVLAPAIVWVSVEYLYPNVFPYRLGAVNAPAIPIAQIADVTGVYGLSFLMVWVATTAVAWFKTREWRVAVAPGLSLVGVLIYGGWRLVELPPLIAAEPELRIALVQGNTPIERKFNKRFYRSNVEQYRKASLARQNSADLIVWPETVVQSSLPAAVKRYDENANPAVGVAKPVLTGTHLFELDELGTPSFFDSAILVGPEGMLWGRYDKQILVPFGEYIPLESTLPWLRNLAPRHGGYAASHEIHVISWPEHFPIAPLICYDDLFASVARAGVRAGGLMLIALNNDAWYGNTASLWQHDTLARWRAVETRRYFAKCDNAGLTNIIDPLGRDTAILKPYVEDVLVGAVRPLRLQTFYTRWGDWFAWANLVAFGALMLLAPRARQPQASKRRR